MHTCKIKLKNLSTLAKFLYSDFVADGLRSTLRQEQKNKEDA